MSPGINIQPSKYVYKLNIKNVSCRKNIAVKIHFFDGQSWLSLIRTKKESWTNLFFFSGQSLKKREVHLELFEWSLSSVSLNSISLSLKNGSAFSELMFR